MSDTFHDTIVIGAGISGLACATNLENNYEDFILISNNIGGRILSSKEGTTNYGAFFVCADYYHVLEYVTCIDRIRLSDFCFHENNDCYPLYSLKIFKYLKQLIKIKKILRDFKKHLHEFRKNSMIMSQKMVFKSDPYLYDLYMKNGDEFVSEHNLLEGTDVYLSKALYSTTFSTIKEMNAFSFLQFLLPLITPIYTFRFDKDKMTNSFKNKILNDTVNTIQYKDKRYLIKTKKDYFQAKNIILATEITWSYQYANIRKFNEPVKTNMLHIRATPKQIIKRKKYHLFSPSNNVQAIADLQDGTYLLYYKNKLPLLQVYFNNPKIIYQKQWNPAGTINGHQLIECDRGNNMYLIGDYNIAGLEESFISGIFGANQIINNH